MYHACASFTSSSFCRRRPSAPPAFITPPPTTAAERAERAFDAISNPFR